MNTPVLSSKPLGEGYTNVIHSLETTQSHKFILTHSLRASTAFVDLASAVLKRYATTDVIITVVVPSQAQFGDLQEKLSHYILQNNLGLNLHMCMNRSEKVSLYTRFSKPLHKPSTVVVITPQLFYYAYTIGLMDLSKPHILVADHFDLCAGFHSYHHILELAHYLPNTMIVGNCYYHDRFDATNILAAVREAPHDWFEDPESGALPPIATKVIPIPKNWHLKAPKSLNYMGIGQAITHLQELHRGCGTRVVQPFVTELLSEIASERQKLTADLITPVPDHYVQRLNDFESYLGLYMTKLQNRKVVDPFSLLETEIALHIKQNSQALVVVLVKSARHVKPLHTLLHATFPHIPVSAKTSSKHHVGSGILVCATADIPADVHGRISQLLLLPNALVSHSLSSLAMYLHPSAVPIVLLGCKVPRTRHPETPAHYWRPVTVGDRNLSLASSKQLFYNMIAINARELLHDHYRLTFHPQLDGKRFVLHVTCHINAFTWRAEPFVGEGRNKLEAITRCLLQLLTLFSQYQVPTWNMARDAKSFKVKRQREMEIHPLVLPCTFDASTQTSTQFAVFRLRVPAQPGTNLHVNLCLSLTQRHYLNDLPSDMQLELQPQTPLELSPAEMRLVQAWNQWIFTHYFGLARNHSDAAHHFYLLTNIDHQPMFEVMQQCCAPDSLPMAALVPLHHILVHPDTPTAFFAAMKQQGGLITARKLAYTPHTALVHAELLNRKSFSIPNDTGYRLHPLDLPCFAALQYLPYLSSVVKQQERVLLFQSQFQLNAISIPRLSAALHTVSGSKTQNYEYLEAIGDSILAILLHLCTFGEQVNSEVYVGWMTRFGKNKHLYLLATQVYQLDQFLEVGAENHHIHPFLQELPDQIISRKGKDASDALEALLGAAWLDGGLAAARQVLLPYQAYFPAHYDFGFGTTPEELRMGPLSAVTPELQAFIPAIEAKIQYTFKHPEYLATAIQCIQHDVFQNSKFLVLGNEVLKAAHIIHFLNTEFSTPKFMCQYRSNVLCRANITLSLYAHGIHDLIPLPPHQRVELERYVAACQQFPALSMYEFSFMPPMLCSSLRYFLNALCAAVFLDTNMDMDQIYQMSAALLQPSLQLYCQQPVDVLQSLFYNQSQCAVSSIPLPLTRVYLVSSAYKKKQTLPWKSVGVRRGLSETTYKAMCVKQYMPDIQKVVEQWKEEETKKLEEEKEAALDRAIAGDNKMAPLPSSPKPKTPTKPKEPKEVKEVVKEDVKGVVKKEEIKQEIAEVPKTMYVIGTRQKRKRQMRLLAFIGVLLAFFAWLFFM